MMLETKEMPMNGQSHEAVMNAKQLEAQMMMLETINNVMTSRQQFMDQFLDPRRDTDKECGYPQTRAITTDLYRHLYDREPIATRIVKVLPEESWQHTPEVYEDEDSETETPFERAWDELAQTLRGKSWYKDEEGSPIWEHLKRADILSGIGHFGILLLGFNDGELLQNPVKGTPPDGWAQDITGISDAPKTPANVPDQLAAKSQVPSGDPYLDSRYGTDSQYGAPPFGTIGQPMTGVETQGEGIKLLFVRAFDESLVQIVQYEANINNPRFGQPVRYKVTLNDPREQHSGVGLPLATVWVHWSRVIHIADNLNSSEIFGAPRMRPVYNRILDLVKLYGGSAEMYWRGAFPGLSIETHPQLGGDVAIDGTAMRSMMERYQNSLQRYIQLSGMSAKSLAPQVVDPTPQINVQIEAICIQLGIPQRIFQGSERGELASTQDDDTWNGRIHERQCNYLTPRVIVPFVDRLIMVGVLPEPNSSKDEENELNTKPNADQSESVGTYNETTPGIGETKSKSSQLGSDKRNGDNLSKDKGSLKKVKQGYCVKWPDLNVLTKSEIATTALAQTQALAAYVSGQVEAIIDPMDYLVKILGFDESEALTIIENVTKHLEDSHPDTEEEVMPGHIPEPPPPEIPPGSPIKMGQGETLFDPNDKSVLHETKPAPIKPTTNELITHGGPGSGPGPGGGAKKKSNLSDALDRWFDFEHASVVKSVSRGENLEHHLTTSGETLSEEHSDLASADEQAIQEAASSTNSGHKILYRGEVISEDKARNIKAGDTYEFDALTASSVDKKISNTYSNPETLGIEGVGVRFHIENPKGVTGIEIKAGKEHPGGEVIIPKGAKYKVARVYEDTDGMKVINLYQSGKQAL